MCSRVLLLPTSRSGLLPKWRVADVPLASFLEDPIIGYEEDEITRLIMDSHDRTAFAAVANLTVGDFRNWLLNYETTTEVLSRLAPGLIPEMVAAVSKLMRNQDLILVASKCRVVTRFRNTLGLPGRLSIRLQPNHPADDPVAIGASILDGILYGCGDAVIGINPATDSVESVILLQHLLAELIDKHRIPTQSCILSHVTTQLTAMERGAPVDLVFQSIAGTEAANASFGINLSLLEQAEQAARSLSRGTVGNNVMYFETGQGSCLSAQAHHGVDQQTLEARAYAVARRFEPLLVNTVVGFIGPEYLFDGKQIIRAGLEDHFCGKLLGLPMGCDVCYTSHAEADQDDMDNLLTLLAVAGCNYFMGVPGADDIMLNYQSTSFHDSHYLRQLLGLRPAPEFETWLAEVGIIDADQRLLSVGPQHRYDHAFEQRNCSVDRTNTVAKHEFRSSPDAWDKLRSVTSARIALGRAGSSLPTREWLDFKAAHASARDAIHNELQVDELAVRIAALGVTTIVGETAAADRLTFLQRPDLGRRLNETSELRFRELRGQPDAYDLAIIVSDGLSALAVDRQVPPLLATLLPRLEIDGWRLAPIVIVRFGRVALQDQIGELLHAKLALMLIGERPGLGAPDSLGAYLVYAPQVGNTDANRNCVSNIRPAGLSLETAADTIAYLLTQARRRQLSGIALKDQRSLANNPWPSKTLQ